MKGAVYSNTLQSFCELLIITNSGKRNLQKPVNVRWFMGFYQTRVTFKEREERCTETINQLDSTLLHLLEKFDFLAHMLQLSTIFITQLFLLCKCRKLSQNVYQRAKTTIYGNRIEAKQGKSLNRSCDRKRHVVIQDFTPTLYFHGFTGEICGRNFREFVFPFMRNPRIINKDGVMRVR